MWASVLSILAWFFGLFKPKSDRELGRAEVHNDDLAAANKDLKHELEIKSRPIGTDDDIISRL